MPTIRTPIKILNPDDWTPEAVGQIVAYLEEEVAAKYAAAHSAAEDRTYDYAARYQAEAYSLQRIRDLVVGALAPAAEGNLQFIVRVIKEEAAEAQKEIAV